MSVAKRGMNTPALHAPSRATWTNAVPIGVCEDRPVAVLSAGTLGRAFDRCHQHRHSPPLHRRPPFDLYGVAELLQDSGEDLVGIAPHEPLASAEEHRELDLVALFEEAHCSLHFDHAVVVVGLGPQPDLLERNNVPVRSVFRLFLLEILVSAVIHDPANGRLFGRRDLDEIETGLPRDRQRFARGDDPELLLILINYADG